MPPYNIMSTAAPRGEEEERSFTLQVDKAPRLGNSIVIWILSSDTDTICQLNQFNANSEAAMLAICRQPPPGESNVIVSSFPQVAELVASTPLQSPAGWYLSHLCCQYNEVLGKKGG